MDELSQQFPISFPGQIIPKTLKVTPKAPSAQQLLGGPSLNPFNSIIHVDFRKGRTKEWIVLTQNLKTRKLSWIDVRRTLKQIFVDKDLDEELLMKIRMWVLRYIPVRSGRLANFIFKTMNLIRRTYHSQYIARFGFSWPAKRPFPIGGRVSHAPPEKGYGEWGTFRPIFNLPNVHVDHVTAGGNALYILDDPDAINDPTSAIINDGQDQIYRDIQQRFANLRIILKI